MPLERPRSQSNVNTLEFKIINNYAEIADHNGRAV
jgi:hypothetical protein